LSLRQKAAKGVKWTATSTAVTTATLLIQRIILANILIPEDFGLVGMITPVVAFAQAFSDMGISQAIIQRQESTREELSSLYWLNIFAGGVAFLGILTVAPLAIDFYDEPRLSELFLWIAPVFLITPLGQQFRMLLQKDLHFQVLAKVEVVAVLIGSTVGIVAALLGSGALSIILATLTTALIRALSLLATGWTMWRPVLHFRLADTRSYLSFGLFQMGERTINYFAANIDYIIIGRYWGERTLGIYTIAYQIIVMPFLRLNPVLTRVAFPLFARKQNDDAALRRGYLELLRLITFVISPMVIGLAIVAPVAVPLLLGDGWEDAITLIQVLALLGILKALSNPTGSLYLAKGRADIGFYFNLAMVIVNTVVFITVVRFGVDVLAVSYVAINATFFIIGLIILYRLIALDAKTFIRNLSLPFVCSIVMAVVVQLVYGSDILKAVNLWLQFFVLVFIGVLVYGAIGFVLMRSYIVEMGRLFFGNQKG
jgi:O-antigen/teichoic acid export membrane protein